MSIITVQKTKVMIRAENLSKIFGLQKVVDNISFSVHKGETLGLLGPNGAGKTTIIKMLTGLVRPTTGRAVLGEYDVQKQPIEAKKMFGICPQELSFDYHLPIDKDLYFYARLYGLSRRESIFSVKRVLKLAKLESHSKKTAYQLSGGMQRRLLVARALLTDPPILFLDEPTTGLDPHSRHEIWEFISNLKENGKSMILTTHYLEEAEFLCDRILIIDHGKKIAEGTPEELKRVLKIKIQIIIKPKSSINSEIIEKFKQIDGVEKVLGDDVFKILLSDESSIEELLSLAIREVGISDLSIKRASLEDVFLHLTGKELRE